MAVAQLADDEAVAPGWVRIEGGMIVARADGPVPDDARTDAAVITADLVMPALVDIHVHGARGVDFSQLGVDPQPAISHHKAHGATTLVASIATGPIPAMAERLRELRAFVESGALAGLHLEGPWLSPRRCGAHRIDLLRHPDPRDVDMLLSAGAGSVRMVTIAPELPGAIATIRALREQGVVAAIGHTDADAATVARAIDAGASVVTHLFNGMRPLHHRDPGPIGVALSSRDVAVELIADGIHVDDVVIDAMWRSARESLVLVSDAMAATGLGDGTYELAGSHVVVADGVARLAEGTSLAGSTHTLGEIVARERSRGAPAPALVASASANPARTLGLPVPSLHVGAAADLIAFTPDGAVRTMEAGRWRAS